MTRRSAVALAGILLLLVALGQYEIRRPPDTSVSATPIAIPSIPTPRYASASLVPSPATKPVAKRPPVTKPWLLPALKQPVSRENQAVFEFKRGVSFSDRNNWEVAIVYYTEAIRLNPEYAEAYYNRGVAYHEKGEPDKAIEDYSGSIRLSPSAVAYIRRAVTYQRQGDQSKADADFAKAKEL